MLLQLRRPAHDVELADGEASLPAGPLPLARTMWITDRTGREARRAAAAVLQVRHEYRMENTGKQDPQCYCSSSNRITWST